VGREGGDGILKNSIRGFEKFISWRFEKITSWRFVARGARPPVADIVRVPKPPGVLQIGYKRNKNIAKKHN
jgi:hypothetical protein